MSTGDRPTGVPKRRHMLLCNITAPIDMLSSLSFPAHRSPPLALLASEPARAFADLFASRAPDVPEAVGDGHRVIVYPGLGAGPLTTWRLRSSLGKAGFAPIDW